MSAKRVRSVFITVTCALVVFLPIISTAQRIELPVGHLQETLTRLNSVVLSLNEAALGFATVTQQLSTVVASLSNISHELSTLGLNLSVPSFGASNESSPATGAPIGDVGNTLISLSATLLELVSRLGDAIQSINQQTGRISSVQRELNSEITKIQTTLATSDFLRNLRLEQGFVTYVVRSGDSLSAIARAYRTSVEQIMRLNGLTDPSRLFVGQVLRIPVENQLALIRSPVRFLPKDVLIFHGQEVGGSRFNGLRISAAGKEIYPMMPGKVLEADAGKVVIDHGNMITSAYKGLNISVRSGSFVSVDTVLGTCAEMLDFEVYVDGEPRDPLRILAEDLGVFSVTFYSEWDDGKVPSHPTFRIARSGVIPTPNRTIAVDPSVIPLGSWVYIPTLSNTIFVAEDTGSAIKGNRIDVYTPDVRIALTMGVSLHPVYVIRFGM